MTSAEDREAGLRRELAPRQVTMIAIGGAIGTGLFLGSTISIGIAGPAVVVTYLIGAVVAFLMTLALGQLSALHPTAGSFGVHAELYQGRLGPWAGFTVRWSYWFAQVIAIGGEVVAAGIYVRFWFPHLPLWIPVVGFSAPSSSSSFSAPRSSSATATCPARPATRASTRAASGSRCRW
jgi:amino acid transporter, AAT family